MRPSRLILLLIVSLGLGSIAQAQPAAVSDLLASSGCRGCHRLDGYGGTFGPPLNKLAGRYDAKRLEQMIRNPRALNPAATMPAYDHLSPQELDQLAAELLRHP